MLTDRPRRWFGLFWSLILLAAPVMQPSRTFAANGDVVHETLFSTDCPLYGLGIAFDGQFLWYSCFGSSPDLYKAEALTGKVVASFNVAGGLGALAWDGKRKQIWAGWGGGAGMAGDIRLIDPATGVGPVIFNAAATVGIGPSIGNPDQDDGLAYDFQDDSLLISPDGSQTIFHYSTAGTLHDSFPWTGTPVPPCYNSGVAIGGALLFQGSDGCNHIWVIKRSDHSAVFDFPTGADGVRDEDLECDSVTFSPKTVIWSMETFSPRRAIAYEIPPGSCGTGGGVDSDGDGLLDEWETNGVTIDGGAGPQFIDLPAMGADPMKPDIFLQIDSMDCTQAGSDCAAGDTHNHKLDPAAIQTIVNAFAASPYVSPTGSVGINLHVDEGPSSILNFTTNATWGALSKAKALSHVTQLGTSSGGMYDWTSFQTIKDANFTPTGRTPIFHYVVSAHNYDTTTSSGVSRGISASDLIVSLGSFPSFGGVGGQGGTLMHELGHNLNLQHGGGDSINYKPNYLSVMNYDFQIGGVIKGGVAGTYDYSRMVIGLDETNLSEPTGLGATAAGFGTSHFCPGLGYVAVAGASGPIDWDCNGDTTGVGVSFDTNNDGALSMLAGFNDWSNLKLKGGGIGLAGFTPVVPIQSPEDLLTVEVAEQILPVPTNKCPSGQGFWKHSAAWPVTSLTLGSQTYTEAQLHALLALPVGTGLTADASLILADQLIAAKLNVARGSDPAPVISTFGDASSLLSSFTGVLPYNVSPNSTIGRQMVADATVLSKYNSDVVTPNCQP